MFLINNLLYKLLTFRRTRVMGAFRSGGLQPRGPRVNWVLQKSCAAMSKSGLQYNLGPPKKSPTALTAPTVQSRRQKYASLQSDVFEINLHVRTYFRNH